MLDTKEVSKRNALAIKSQENESDQPQSETQKGAQKDFLSWTEAANPTQESSSLKLLGQDPHIATLKELSRRLHEKHPEEEETKILDTLLRELGCSERVETTPTPERTAAPKEGPSFAPLHNKRGELNQKLLRRLLKKADLNTMVALLQHYGPELQQGEFKPVAELFIGRATRVAGWSQREVFSREQRFTLYKTLRELAVAHAKGGPSFQEVKQLLKHIESLDPILRWDETRQLADAIYGPWGLGDAEQSVLSEQRKWFLARGLQREIPHLERRAETEALGKWLKNHNLTGESVGIQLSEKLVVMSISHRGPGIMGTCKNAGTSVRRALFFDRRTNNLKDPYNLLDSYTPCLIGETLESLTAGLQKRYAELKNGTLKIWKEGKLVPFEGSGEVRG